MQLKTDDNADFVRFLKDEKFIEWKLFPTDELNAYWTSFLQEFPQEQENLRLAEKHFHRIKLLSGNLPREKKNEAVKRLESSLLNYKKKRKIRRFTYAATAAVAAVIFLLAYLHPKPDTLHRQLHTSYIKGQALASEDILLISGNHTTSFQENIDVKINNNQTAHVKSGESYEKEISMAANAMNILIVPYGKRSKVVLPDGTHVWLNSGSTLEFPSAFTNDKREVYLSGEMYIEVAHSKNKSFYVYTSDFNVKVYGTRFNVSSYADSHSSSVVLVEGSVSLQAEGRPGLRLSPNEQAVYTERGVASTQKVDVRSFISWKDGYLTYEDTPMTEVLKQIERYYNLSFNYEENITLQELTCTGKIILSDNLDNVMTTLALISSTTYKREGIQIYIYKK